MVAVAAVAAVLLYQQVKPAEPAGVRSWPVADLPRHVYRTGATGQRVRVTFPLPLQPTADPLVWHYHPGHPPKIAPPTYRVHFQTIEQALTVSGDTVAVVVEGTVEGIAPDLVRRVSGVPGVLVLRGAVRVAP